MATYERECGSAAGGVDEGGIRAANRRVVVLIDMDCFYCQVEEFLQPVLRGKPLAVVQYNPWKGGGIIAVNYAARARGVTRHMRGDAARAVCPDIQLCSVPCVRGKADISKYRDAGQRVARVLQRFTPLLERASIDEAYLDITQLVEERLKAGIVDWDEVATCPDTFAVGYERWAELAEEVRAGGAEGARALTAAALLVRDIRAAVLRDTGYECSAGIANNKMLAKLVCGLNKPNKQTVLVEEQLAALYSTLPLRKLRHLGGKFGERVCRELGITVAADLQRISRATLQARFQYKNGNWLYAVARGLDEEPVRARLTSQSIGCCKKFAGAAALTHERDLRRWLHDLAAEIEERLQRDALDNDRRPRHMVVSFTYAAPAGDVSASRSHALPVSLDREVDADLLYTLARRLIADTLAYEEDSKLQMPIKFLGLSVGKFDNKTESQKLKTIVDFFTPQSSDTKELDTADTNTTLSISEAGKNSLYKKTNNDADATECNKVLKSDDCENSVSFVQNFLNDKHENICSESEQVNLVGASTADLVSEEECPRCGERIPSDQLQTHTDYHLAVELSTRDDAEQGRSREPREVAPHSIRRYLMQTASEGGGDVCTECGLSVSPAETLQHRDLHLARRISIQLNRRRLVASVPATLPTTPPAAKRKRVDLAHNKAKKQCATLHTFFR